MCELRSLEQLRKGELLSTKTPTNNEQSTWSDTVSASMMARAILFRSSPFTNQQPGILAMGVVVEKTFRVKTFPHLIWSLHRIRNYYSTVFIHLQVFNHTQKDRLIRRLYSTCSVTHTGIWYSTSVIWYYR